MNVKTVLKRGDRIQSTGATGTVLKRVGPTGVWVLWRTGPNARHEQCVEISTIDFERRPGR